MGSQSATVEVLHHDEALLAIAKPAGMLVHRSRIAAAADADPPALQLARAVAGRRVYPVHRLDRPTAGVLLFALDPDTARVVSGEFEAGRVDKRYLAVVRGFMAESGSVAHPLAPVGDAYGPAWADPSPRDAVTHWRRLAEVELPHAVGRYPSARYSLVELNPRTGRRHQLRRHMKHLFHPIIGDTTYGDGRHNRFFREQFGCHRLLLLARSLELRHPTTAAPLRLQAPPDAGFAAVLTELGWGEVAC